MRLWSRAFLLACILLALLFTVSAGIASLPEDVTQCDDLVPAADRALYVAKRSGRNLIEVA